MKNCTIGKVLLLKKSTCDIYGKKLDLKVQNCKFGFRNSSSQGRDFQ